MGVQSQVEYNDNILLEESNEESDVIYRVSPWIELKGKWSRLQTELNYKPQYTWYEKNRQYDHAGHDVALNLYGNLAKTFNMAWNNRFYRGEERASEGQDLQGDARLPFSQLSSVLSGTWATGRDETFGFSITGESFHYDKKSSSQDSSEAGGRISSRQTVGQHGFLTLDAGYSEGWYEDSTSYQISSGTLGAERQVDPQKRLFGRVGFSRYTGESRTDYFTLNPNVGLAGEFRNGNYDLGAGVLMREEENSDANYDFSVVGSVNVTTSWRRGALTVSLESGHEEKYTDSDSPGFDTYVSGIFSGWYGMARGWKASGSCGLRDDAYQDNRPGAEDRNDVTLQLTGGIEHQVMRRATLRIDCTHNARWSNIDEQEYRENMVVLTLNCFTQ